MSQLSIKSLGLLLLLAFSLSCTDDDSEDQADPIAIGDFHEGGIVFYIDSSGEQGLVVALSDQSFEAPWGCPPIVVQGADATQLGTGAQNTVDINSSCSTAGIAAALCADLQLNGFDDWFLPSQDELNELYITADAIEQAIIDNGGNAFDDTEYWTSSQQTSNTVFAQNFNGGTQLAFPEDQLKNVRAIRAF